MTVVNIRKDMSSNELEFGYFFGAKLLIDVELTDSSVGMVWIFSMMSSLTDSVSAAMTMGLPVWSIRKTMIEAS